MTDFADQRVKMVDSQLRTEAVTDYDILDAMGAVPREAFVPVRYRDLAYIDDDLPLNDAAEGKDARFLMRPAAFARLIQAAEIDKTDIVLDTGCATGYSAAVLARLADSVVALESDSALAAAASALLGELGVGNAAVVTGPLHDGYPSEGPYDVIVVEGAVEAVPEALFAQLKEGGRLVAVVGRGRAASAMVYTRSEGDFGGRPAFDAFVPTLPGFARPKAFVF